MQNGKKSGSNNNKRILNEEEKKEIIHQLISDKVYVDNVADAVKIKISDDEFNKIRTDITTQIEANAKNIAKDEAEKKANTTVFTAFGVFATIVTIIISFVISSSTWLSSAGRTEAVFAFLIPSGVAVAVVLIILGVVFFRTDVVESGKINWGAFAFYIVIFAVAAVIMVLMCHSAYHLSKAAKTEITDQEITDHVRYIIQAGQYSIIDEADDDKKDKTGQTIRYYVFTIDGVEQKIEKKDVILHNDEIWYCADHCRIE